jgi:hypothetical protein
VTGGKRPGDFPEPDQGEQRGSGEHQNSTEALVAWLGGR